MKSRERLEILFLEDIHEKKKLIAVVSGAVGLLVLALVARYGIASALKQSKELRAAKNNLVTAIKLDDKSQNNQRQTAAKLAEVVVSHFHELSKKVDDLDWSEQEIQVLQYLPNILNHSGPKHG